MQLFTLTATLLVLTVIGFYLGRGRALATASGRIRDLHSLPSYYGYYVALWCALPALLILTAWLMGEQQIVRGLLVSGLPESAQSLPPERLGPEQAPWALSLWEAPRSLLALRDSYRQPSFIPSP